ncbi:MAG: hypothetical protein ACTSVB_05630 [Candidatus Heimdallarchaeaceae archaeon]
MARSALYAKKVRVKTIFENGSTYEFFDFEHDYKKISKLWYNFRWTDFYHRITQATDRTVVIMKRVAPYNPKRRSGTHLRDEIYGYVTKIPRNRAYDIKVTIFANKHYAVFLEFGTSKMSPRPFFRRSVLQGFSGVVDRKLLIKAMTVQRFERYSPVVNRRRI